MNIDIQKFAELFKVEIRILGIKYSALKEETKWFC